MYMYKSINYQWNIMQSAAVTISVQQEVKPDGCMWLYTHTALVGVCYQVCVYTVVLNTNMTVLMCLSQNMKPDGCIIIIAC